MTEPRHRFDDVLDHLRRFVALRACLEVGAFAALRDGAASAAELAARLEVLPHPLELHLNACVQLGLLDKRGEHFQLHPGDAPLFGPGGPFRPEQIGALESELVRWSTATQVLRGGPHGAGSAGSGAMAPLPVRLRFHRMLAERSRAQVEATADWLAEHEPRTVLDLGCGSAAYGIALLQRLPGARLLAVDLPGNEDLIETFAREAGVWDRIEIHGIDVLVEPPPGPADLCLLSNVVHIFDAPTNQALLARARAALAPGGVLAVKDYVVSPSGTEPEHGALFPVLMAVWGHGGRTWPESTVRGWLSALGLDTDALAFPGREASYVVRGT